MNLTNRQQLLGFLAIAAVVLLAGDRLVFEPLLKIWRARTESIADLKKSVIRGTGLLEREKSTQQRWDNMRNNSFSNEVSVAEGQMLRAFDRWSQDARIGISSVKPQLKLGDEAYSTIACRVDAFGSLPALTRFLYDIEKDPLALKVEAVEIASRTDNGDQLTLGLLVSGLLLNQTETK